MPYPLFSCSLDATDVYAITCLQAETVHETNLGAGELAQCVSPDTGFGTMLKPATPLIEERRREVSLDGMAIGEKIFEHDSVSLLWKAGSCHAGKTGENYVAVGAIPLLPEVPVIALLNRDTGAFRGSGRSRLRWIPGKSRFCGSPGMGAFERIKKQGTGRHGPEVGGASPCRRSDTQIQVPFERSCCGDSSQAAV